MIRTAAVLTTLVLAACGANPAPAPKPADPPAETVTTQPEPTQDLAGVLIQPDDYEPMPGDTVSGPLQSVEDLRNFFTDHPDDLAAIKKNGFVAGYTQSWRRTATAPATSPEFLDRPNAMGIVLDFASEEGARTVLDHFRAHNRADGYEFFDVPGELAGGYGASLVQPGLDPTLSTYFYGVAWPHGARLLDVSITYFTRPPSPADVIAYAAAQEKALG
jgi:hypothetical protein